MKWFEIITDNGDGSSSTLRFQTEEKARMWLEQQSDYPGEEDCYPYGPIEDVDTDSKWFWTEPEEEID